MGIYTPYPRKDAFTPLIKTPKEILAMESVNFPKPPPLIGTPEKQNLTNFVITTEIEATTPTIATSLKKQIEEVVASRKLAHLVKDIRQNNQRNGSQRRNNVKVINMIRGGGNHKRPFEEGRSGLTDELTFPSIPRNQLMDKPIILEGVTEGHRVRRILVDGGSSSEIMYEHCFRNFNVNIQSRLRRCKTPMIGRTRMRSIRAVGSTIYFMIKFPTNQGIMTSREAQWDCKHLEKVQVHNNGEHVDSQLQTVINRHALGKHGGIRMGRIRKNIYSEIYHEASTKDIPPRRASGP
ncbi:hypothetical protein Tco_0928044 [Tanacetum coccineum]